MNSKNICNRSEGLVCFWSWNDKIEFDEIEKQLRDFYSKGFSGVIIHSRAGLRIQYMGASWFNCYSFAIEKAKELGLEIWIYDEDGWPSGFASGKVQSKGKEYCLKSIIFSDRSMGNPKTRLAAYRKFGDEYKLVPNEKAKLNDLIVWYEIDANYVDLLNKETVKVFIEETHEKYKAHFGQYFGNVIKGVFTDEPQFTKYPWSDVLAAQWEKHFGGNIYEKLYMLVIESGEWRKFRLDFRHLLSDLFYDSFTVTISEWCQKNGLIFTGHYAGEDSLLQQVGYNAGVMRHYKRQHMPCIDYLGNRILSPVVIKQVASVAHQFNKEDVMSEVFGCAGWNISFDRIKWIWGNNSVMGVTKPCLHLSPYSIIGRRKRDYPAFYSDCEPWWDSAKELVQWIDNLNRLMKEGERIVETLVISPIDSVSADYGNDTSIVYSVGFRTLLDNLLSCQLEFDIGDESLISTDGFIKEGQFGIGKALYKNVIIANCSVLRESTVKLLGEFEKSGGRIFYSGIKPDCPDFKSLVLPSGNSLPNAETVIEKTIKHFNLERWAVVQDSVSGKRRKGVIIHMRRTSFGFRIHLWTDYNFYGDKNTVVSVLNEFNGECSAYLVDILTGKRNALPYENTGSRLLIKVPINLASNTVIEVRKNESADIELRRTLSVEYIDHCSVKLCDKNSLTLDCASFSVNDSSYTEEKAIINEIDSIYKKCENINTTNNIDVKVKYSFYCDSLEFSKEMEVVFEDVLTEYGEINGQRIEKKLSECWISKGFGRYDISQYVCKGKNEIILHYKIPKNINKYNDGFETERNRFFFPIEPESIYLRGDFDVICDAPIMQSENCLNVNTKKFILTVPTEKRLGDLTKQNALFYRGKAEYVFEYEYKDLYDCIYIKVDNCQAVTAEIIVSDRKKQISGLNQEIDITDMLEIGKNVIKVILTGSNRNLFGPHHHIKGEVDVVGPDTFTGVYGFEDFVSPDINGGSTWTDSYNFMPFGCEGFYIIRKQTLKQ